MNIFREIPPTAGFPVYAKDLLSALMLDKSRDHLEDDFKNYLNVDFARITCSGTAALYIIAETLKEISSRQTVIVPSFICPLVPLALKRAGLTIAVCDIEENSFNFNPVEFESVCASSNDIAAVIINHLAGIPFDFDSIKGTIEKHNLLVIEDCAQSLGALYKGKKVGTLGDFSFFSLAAGKGLTLYEGGALITNKNEYARAVERNAEKLLRFAPLTESIRILQLTGYWIFYRPILFWFVFKLPQIYWNMRGKMLKAAMEDFSIDFPVHRVSGFRKSLGHVMFHRLQNEIGRQRENALCLIEGLKNLKGLKVITESPHDRATYPYLTLLFDTMDKQKEALKIIGSSGLGASRIYALAIADYGYLRDIVPDKNCSNARSFADRSITLSTSTFLSRRDLNTVIQIISNML
jgi:dTDP-4-amino-4,6-dideoxygalactose transaminase